MLIKPPGSVPAIEAELGMAVLAKQCYYTPVVRDVRLFPIDLKWERNICKSAYHLLSSTNTFMAII